MKKTIAILISLLLACGCAAAESRPAVLSDAAIVEEVVGNLSLLTQVPRPSHHEEKISAYFMNWAKEQGFEPVQDESLNVMFDVPATAGMETKPLVILQVHMDMVVAYENGKDFDPLNDPITMIRNEEENTLTADGTSLGADDGAGCALAMAAAKGLMAHGPLRVIITTDEEDGMDGAFHMSSAWLDGAAYLINLDNEASDQVLVSTAAGDTVTASVKPEFSAASGDLALKMELSGLKGGHSGVEIDKGRLNGIIALAGLLRNLEKQNIRFELASFEGGTANNAIPNRAGCEIVIGSGDEDAVKALAADYCSSLQKAYTGIEEGIRLDVSRDEAVPAVVDPETQQHIIRYLTEIIDGVYTMSADMEGLVESSSNLGIAVLNPDGFCASGLLRSSVGSLEEEIINAQLQLAKECGLEAATVRTALPWTFDPDSRLLALAQKVYNEQNNEEISVVAVHAGLECGTFKVLNPSLDMISIGPDLKDVHTTGETFYLDTLPRTWHLLEGLLAGV